MAEKANQDGSFALDEPEPWHDAVSGDGVIDETVASIRRFVVLPDYADAAVALWCAFVHAHDLFQHSPRLAQDLGDDLAFAEPSIPSALGDRAADNWRPLLAIADAVGGHWPETARQAAIVLAGTLRKADHGEKRDPRGGNEKASRIWSLTTMPD